MRKHWTSCISCEADYCKCPYRMVYPGKQVGGLEADMMASDELKSHAFLQVVLRREQGAVLQAMLKLNVRSFLKTVLLEKRNSGIPLVMDPSSDKDLNLCRRIMCQDRCVTIELYGQNFC
ncbi:hypothetical protein Tco_0829014 [Tanacetum coccineum]